jgi:hypothetical protein
MSLDCALKEKAIEILASEQHLILIVLLSLTLIYLLQVSLIFLFTVLSVSVNASTLLVILPFY